MGLYPILLVAIVMAADADPQLVRGGGGVPAGQSALYTLGPMVAILAATAALMWLSVRGVDAGRGPGGILRAERIARGARMLLLIQHAAAVFFFGWLGAVRSAVGDPVLLDEIIAIVPPLLGAMATWWLYYPVERRLREALLIRRLDLGEPVYPLPSRGRYVLLQTRLHLLFLLVPVLLIVACSEVIDLAAQRWGGDWPVWQPDVMKIAAAILIFLIAPLLAPALLDTQPLAPGTLRDELLEICRRHGVRVRDILVWNTSGMMINAAVMGLVSRLRYVLITDALLESMPLPQVRAVMAHEVAHVRRRHIPWLAAVLIAAVVASWLVVQGTVIALDVLGVYSLSRLSEWGQTMVLAGHLLLALALFGWVCRRVERQADTFAVQHLSGMGAVEGSNGQRQAEAGEREEASAASGVVTNDAVEAMRGALATIARLNAVQPRRRSWRHGSIAWRREYLLDLIGQPIERLAIDRQVRWIKAATAIMIAGVVALAALQATNQSPRVTPHAAAQGTGDDTWATPPQP